MPMVRPMPGPRPLLSKLGHLAIQLGFANSIRSFYETGFHLAFYNGCSVIAPTCERPAAFYCCIIFRIPGEICIRLSQVSLCFF